MKKQYTGARLVTAVVIVLSALNIPLALCGDPLPEASPGFVPQSTYAVDVPTMDSAIASTFQNLSIPTVQVTSSRFVTDYIEGPTTTAASGRVTRSRYKYIVSVGQFLNKTRVSILVVTEASSGPEGAASNWHDVTGYNHAVAVKAQGWLYQKIEQTLAGGSPSNASAATSVPSATAPGATNAGVSSGTAHGVIPPFDVIGMHLGEHPKEIATAINARLLDKVNEHLTENKETLTITGPSSRTPISLGDFLESQRAETVPGKQTHEFGKRESFEVHYTPEPGAERAAIITRRLSYAEAGISPLETTIKEELTKKYGAPSILRDNGVNQGIRQAVWSVGTHGPIDKSQFSRSTNCMGFYSSSGNWDGVIFGTNNTKEIQDQINACGAAFVYATWNVRNPAAPQAERLVSTLTVGMYSPSLVAEVIRDLNNRGPEIDKAAAAESARKAKDNKPDL